MTCHQEIDQMSCHHRNKMTEVEHDCMGGGELKLFRHFWAKFLHVWFSTLCKEGVGIETAVDWTDWPKGCDFCAILKPTPSGQIVFKRLVLGAETLNPTEVGSLSMADDQGGRCHNFNSLVIHWYWWEMSGLAAIFSSNFFITSSAPLLSSLSLYLPQMTSKSCGCGINYIKPNMDPGISNLTGNASLGFLSPGLKYLTACDILHGRF